MSTRKRIAVDFDGVIHSYTTPWQGGDIVPDPPVEGALVWLKEMTDIYEVVILSSRARDKDGRDAILDWLEKHLTIKFAETRAKLMLKWITVTATKLPAGIYIDDRGYRFEGQFPSADEVAKLSAKTWNR